MVKINKAHIKVHLEIFTRTIGHIWIPPIHPIVIIVTVNYSLYSQNVNQRSNEKFNYSDYNTGMVKLLEYKDENVCYTPQYIWC